MFRVEHNVPEVFVHESRDFQLFCRLYDLVLQASRFSIDSMKLISDTQRCNNTLLPLLGSKVGIFEEFKDVSDSVSRLILDAFPKIIRAKGSRKALHLVANVCSRITGSQVHVSEDFLDRNTIYVDFIKPLHYMSIFAALIEYVRPAGCVIRYRINVSAKYSMNEPDFTMGVATVSTSSWGDDDLRTYTAPNTPATATSDIFKKTVGFTKVYVPTTQGDTATTQLEGGNE